MSSDLSVVFKERLSEAEIVQLVNQCGGYWSDKPDEPPQSGAICRGGAAIYIYYIGEGDWSDFSARDLDTYTQLLGQRPNSAVIVNVGHGEGSFDLANEFVRLALGKWDGILDDDHGGYHTRDEVQNLDIRAAIRRSYNDSSD